MEEEEIEMKIETRKLINKMWKMKADWCNYWKLLKNIFLCDRNVTLLESTCNDIN